MPLRKRNVYLVDFGTQSDRNLLPLGAGLIASYSKSLPEINEYFNIEVLFADPNISSMVTSLDNPVIIGVSCYMWNLKASMYFSRLVKERYKNCLIVVGGYSIPKWPDRKTQFFKENPFVDVMVHGEGEIAFSDILISLLLKEDLSKVKGVSIRSGNEERGYIETPPRERIQDLNILPSPFLDGTFDQIIKKHGSFVTGAILETNRGCPFACTFCDWGDADVNQVKKFDIDRVHEELKWLSRNKIYYIYGADANFGIFYNRDLEIAGHLADLCKKHDFPKYFMMNFTKNTSEKIVSLAKKLADGGVLTNVTLAIQSFYPSTLEAIKRKNIKTKFLLELKRGFHDQQLPTYMELIMALPEETYSTFKDGLEQALSPRLSDHLMVYLCYILENTEMADLNYMEKYKIETRVCSLGLTRRKLNDSVREPETEKIVVGTSTMPINDWRRAYNLGFLTMALYNFRLAFFICIYFKSQFAIPYTDFIKFILSELESQPADFPFLKRGLDHLKNLQNSILNNQSSMVPIAELGDTVFSPSEGLVALYLTDLNSLYNDLKKIANNFVKDQNLSCSKKVIDEVVLYQKIRTPAWKGPQQTKVIFESNQPIFFDYLTRGLQPPQLDDTQVEIEVIPKEEPSEDYLKFVLSNLLGGHTMTLYEVKTKAIQLVEK